VDGDEGVRLTIGRIEPVSARLPLARFTQRPLRGCGSSYRTVPDASRTIQVNADTTIPHARN